MARAILANSPGWKLIGPRLTQMRAPLMFLPSPGTSGSISSTGADEEQQPAVAGEVGGPLDEQQRGDERADGDEAPGRLEAGEPIVEAGDHHESDAVQQGGEREHHAVGTAGDQTNHDVGTHQQAEQDPDEEDDPGRDLGVRSERGDRVGRPGDQRRHDQQREFGRPPLAREGRRDREGVVLRGRGNEVVALVHGAAIVVAPVGALSSPVEVVTDDAAERVGRRDRRRGRGGRRRGGGGRGRRGGRGGAAADELGGLLLGVEGDALVDHLGPVGFELVTRRAGVVLRRRVDPQHATLTALVDDGLIVVVEGDEVAAARPHREHHEADHDRGGGAERDGELDEPRSAQSCRLLAVGRLASVVRSSGPVGSSGRRWSPNARPASSDSGPGGGGTVARRRPTSARRRSRASGPVARRPRARRRRSP